VRPLIALVGAMVAACAVAATLQAAAAGAQPLYTGISGLNEDALLAFQRVKDTGARYVRIPLNWFEIAPKAKPGAWQPDDPSDSHYDWSRPDEDVVNAVSAGLVPIAMVEEVPQWVERCKAFGGGNCDPDPDALAAFATAAARRYSGSYGGLPRVGYWQGLNEPNLSAYFNPQFLGDRAVSPSIYRNLAERFYAAVKAVNPAALVILGGLSPLAVAGYAIGPMRFTRELLCMKGRVTFRPTRGDCGGPMHFDIFDIHPYTTGGPTHMGGDNDVQMGDLPKLRALLAAADEAGRIDGAFERTPLWVGEFAWDSNPPDPGGLPMKIGKRWVAEALYRAWRAGVDAFFWFGLRDRTPQPNLPFNQTLQSGLYFRGPSLAEDQPKEILYAFRFPFVSFPSKKGLFFWGRTPNSGPGAVVIQIFKDGRWRQAAVARANKGGMFRGFVPTGYGSKKRGAARAVYQGQATIPFSMRPVADFIQPPFG
jgi:hypothetical protein